MRRQILIGILGFLPIAFAVPDKAETKPFLHRGQSVFVAGKNVPANAALKELLVQSCFALVSEVDAADAVLTIETSGIPGSRDWTAEGTLSLKSGGGTWSKAVRFDDAPYSTNGKRGPIEAGRMIARALARDAGCPTSRAT
jgi:hypothetical protein